MRPTSKAGLGTAPLHLFEHTGGDHLRYVRPPAPFPGWGVDNQDTDPQDRNPQLFQFGGMSVIFPDRPKIDGPRENNPMLTAAMVLPGP